MLPKEQITQIKQQLIQQIETTFPEDKKQAAKQQVETMDGNQLEEFLKQNNLIKEGQPSIGKQQNVFRNIISGQIPSHKIDENKDALAVLEINPISKGHILVIPKKTTTSVEKIPQSAFSLAKKISKRLKSKLTPKNVNNSSANVFEEFIINVFPVYENESLNSQRYHAKETELQEIQKKLEKKTITKIIRKPPKKIQEKEIRLPKRIP